MLSNYWAKGPAIISSGFFQPWMAEPIVSTSLWETDDTIPQLERRYTYELDCERELELRKRSGVQRPRSCSINAVFAGLLGRKLLGLGQLSPESVGVCTSSASTVTSTAIKFENRGLLEGWDNVDPLSLPHTIPSSLATHTAISLGLKAFALSFLDGFLGFFHSLETVCSMLSENPENSALVLFAEEASAEQQQVLADLQITKAPCIGAGGLVVCGSGIQSSGPKICYWAHGAPDEIFVRPSELQEAVVCTVIGSSETPYLNTLDPLNALIRGLGASSQVIVLGEQPHVGWAAIGVQCD